MYCQNLQRKPRCSVCKLNFMLVQGVCWLSKCFIFICKVILLFSNYDQDIMIFRHFSSSDKSLAVTVFNCQIWISCIMSYFVPCYFVIIINDIMLLATRFVLYSTSWPRLYLLLLKKWNYFVSSVFAPPRRLSTRFYLTTLSKIFIYPFCLHCLLSNSF